MIYIIMGVSGSGKSTLGKMLASKLNLPFKDGDDFHPQKNIEKMSKSIPLTDRDRQDWLMLLARQLKLWQEEHSGVVLACSALKQQYRDVLNQNSLIDLTYIYPKGSYQLIYQRLSTRQNHFMCKSLLKSQFEILEEPTDAIVVNLELSPSQQLEKIMSQMVCNI
jgi:carbohydrate kinase (thermoresistant glucokinase family)